MGLLYIEVDFANEQEHPDADKKPKIDGDEDRTNYSFVDFSKKPPAEQENQENQMKYCMDVQFACFCILTVACLHYRRIFVFPIIYLM